METAVVTKSKYLLNILIESDDEVLISKYQEAIDKRRSEDAGFDLFIPDELDTINKSLVVNHKIKCEMLNLKTGEYISYLLYPRSSTSNYKIVMYNGVGVIDSGYRGPISAKFHSLGDLYEIIPKYSRLCQLCHPNLKPFDIKLVNKLSESLRGTGGFGSTGK